MSSAPKRKVLLMETAIPKDNLIDAQIISLTNFLSSQPLNFYWIYYLHDATLIITNTIPIGKSLNDNCMS